LLKLGLYQFAARCDAGQLLQQQTSLSSTAESELADELFVSRAMARGALNATNQLAIGLRIGSASHE
jgi:hypothetical protein